MFLGKRALKKCSKYTGEHPCQSVILIKLQSNFTEIKLRYGCSPVNLLHTFRSTFPQNTTGELRLTFLNHCLRWCTPYHISLSLLMHYIEIFIQYNLYWIILICIRQKTFWCNFENFIRYLWNVQEYPSNLKSNIKCA